jgi:hypothetical protein
VTYTKTLLCFANSWKHGGSCIAGREITDGVWGPWVRPISDREGHEISWSEKHCTNNSPVTMLDIVDIGFRAPQPSTYQQENHVIDGSQWVHRGTTSWREVQGASEDPKGPLWQNGSSSSSGVNDSVTEQATAKFGRSLYLIRPEALEIVVQMEGGHTYPAKQKIRARFKLCGHSYFLSVTDSMAPQRFPNLGTTAITDALLCISLSEVLAETGHAYKLVAGLITP